MNDVNPMQPSQMTHSASIDGIRCPQPTDGIRCPSFRTRFIGRRRRLAVTDTDVTVMVAERSSVGYLVKDMKGPPIDVEETDTFLHCTGVLMAFFKFISLTGLNLGRFCIKTRTKGPNYPSRNAQHGVKCTHEIDPLLAMSIRP